MEPLEQAIRLLGLGEGIPDVLGEGARLYATEKRDAQRRDVYGTRPMRSTSKDPLPFQASRKKARSASLPTLSRPFKNLISSSE